MLTIKEVVQGNDDEKLAIAICNELIKHNFPVDKIDDLMIQILRFPNHYKFKNYILEKFDHKVKCEICGVKKNLELHHLKPVATFPELKYDEKNICLLCPVCHSLTHDGGGSTNLDKPFRSKVKKVFKDSLNRNYQKNSIILEKKAFNE